MTDHDTPDPRLDAALAALDEGRMPSPALEERTVRELRRRGLLATREPRLRLGAGLARVAAGLAFALLGYAVGVRRTEPVVAPAVASASRFLLLLREDASFRAPEGGSKELVAEYSAWARSLRGVHHLESGEELDRTSVVLPDKDSGETAVGSPRIAGFFILLAGSDAEARAIAESCPHLRHGGTIELRRILPT